MVETQGKHGLSSEDNPLAVLFLNDIRTYSASSINDPESLISEKNEVEEKLFSRMQEREALSKQILSISREIYSLQESGERRLSTSIIERNIGDFADFRNPLKASTPLENREHSIPTQHAES